MQRPQSWGRAPVRSAALALAVFWSPGARWALTTRRPAPPWLLHIRNRTLHPAAGPPDGGWKHAQPGDDGFAASGGSLWRPQLNRLEERVTVSNQNLKASPASTHRRSLPCSNSVPFISLQFQLAPGYFAQPNIPEPPVGVLQSRSLQRLRRTGQASWEPDLWGHIRRTVQQSRANAQASAADLANVELSLRSELAMDYFELRGLDTQKQFLDGTVRNSSAICN